MQIDLIKFDIPFFLKNEYDFQLFIKELYNAEYGTNSFQQRGVRGQEQNGFDVFSHELGIAIECKKKDLRFQDIKTLRNQLLQDVVDSKTKFDEFELNSKFNKLIIASNFKDDAILQNKAIELSNEHLNVSYIGWDTLVEYLNNHEGLKTKYYPFIMEFQQLGNYSKKIKRKDLTEDEKNAHVLIKLTNAFERFLPFIILKRNTLNNLYPINNTEDYAHHIDYTLQITNDEVYTFLKSIKEDEHNNLIIDESLKMELAEIKDHEKKIIDCVHFFRNNMVFEITQKRSAEEVKLPILQSGEKCSCEKCSYENLDFKTVIDKITENNKDYSKGDDYDKLRNAYTNFKMGNYKQAYSQLNHVIRFKNNPSDNLKFLCLYNLINLRQLIKFNYSNKESKGMLEKIDEIDMEDYIVRNYQDEEIKEQFLWLKEGTFVKHISYSIDIELQKIRTAQRLQQNPQTAIPKLYQHITYAYYYIRQNQIFYDHLHEFEQLVLKSIEGFLMCYKIQHCTFKKEGFTGFGSQPYTMRFSEFLLDLMIHYIRSSDLEELFKRFGSDKIKISCSKEFIEKIINLLNSGDALNKFIKKAIKSDNYAFTYDCDRIFSNVFYLLSKIELESDLPKEIAESIIGFLRKRPAIMRPHSLLKIKYLFFNERLSKLFSKENHLTILNILIKKYPEQHEISRSILSSLQRNFPGYQIDSTKLIADVIKVYDQKKVADLIDFWFLSNDKSKVIIENYIRDGLDQAFNFDVYLHAAINRVIDHERYLEKAIEEIEPMLNSWDYETVCNKAMPKSFTPNWFIELLYKLSIDTTDTRFDRLRGKHLYFDWLLDPENYDYNKFDIEWLLIYDFDIYTDRLKTVKEFKLEIEKALKSSYNPEIAKIYHHSICE